MTKLCGRCNANEAVIYLNYARLWLCKDCFIKFYLRRVEKTVDKYKMLRNFRVVGVAISGGKDSASLLHALKTLSSDIEFIAFHVNAGIGEYSRESEKKARELAEMLDVEIYVYRYRDVDGFEIPDFKNTKYDKRICATCSTLRRWTLNKLAREYRVNALALGHNLDDTVEVMLNLFLTGEFDQLRRLKPVLPPMHPSQVWRIKPLIKIPEFDNLYYASYNNLPFRYGKCPYAKGARSIRRKKILDIWERRERNIKFQLFSIFTNKLIPILDKTLPREEYNTCKICGGASYGDVCSACKIKQYIISLKQSSSDH